MDKSCFADCKNLKQIESSNYIKNIGETGFYSCTSLRTVTVKGRVTKCKILLSTK